MPYLNMPSRPGHSLWKRISSTAQVPEKSIITLTRSSYQPLPTASNRSCYQHYNNYSFVQLHYLASQPTTNTTYHRQHAFRSRPRNYCIHCIRSRHSLGLGHPAHYLQLHERLRREHRRQQLQDPHRILQRCLRRPDSDRRLRRLLRLGHRVDQRCLHHQPEYSSRLCSLRLPRIVQVWPRCSAGHSLPDPEPLEQLQQRHHPLALQGPRPGAPASHRHHRPRDRQECRQEGLAEVAHQDRLL